MAQNTAAPSPSEEMPQSSPSSSASTSLWMKCSFKANPCNRNQVIYFERDRIFFFFPQKGKTLLIGKARLQALNPTSNLKYWCEVWKSTRAQEGIKMPSKAHKSGKYQASKKLIFNECYSWPQSSTAIYFERYLERNLEHVKNKLRVCQCQCIIGQIKGCWGSGWAVIC